MVLTAFLIGAVAGGFGACGVFLLMLFAFRWTWTKCSA